MIIIAMRSEHISVINGQAFSISEIVASRFVNESNFDLVNIFRKLRIYINWEV